jgi:hypothetical protein
MAHINTELHNPEIYHHNNAADLWFKFFHFFAGRRAALSANPTASPCFSMSHEARAPSPPLFVASMSLSVASKSLFVTFCLPSVLSAEVLT